MTSHEAKLTSPRAPKAPDAHADMGRHTFRYAILPHEGPVGDITVRTAAAFNSPTHHGHISVTDISVTEALLSTLTLSGSPSIILDHIKRGEDDDDVSTGGLPTRKGQSLILRLYDSLGGRASTTISTYEPHLPFVSALLMRVVLQALTGEGSI